MVPFAGYSMPLLYTSIQDEHQAVRTHVGMFDLSHMGEFFCRGDGALRRAARHVRLAVPEAAERRLDGAPARVGQGNARPRLPSL